MLFFVQQRKEIGGENMSEQVLQAVAIQKIARVVKTRCAESSCLYYGNASGKGVASGRKSGKGKAV